MSLSRRVKGRLGTFACCAVVCLFLLTGVMLVNPVRNAVIPGWSRLWGDISTFDVWHMYKVIDRLTPLLFLPPSCPGRDDTKDVKTTTTKKKKKTEEEKKDELVSYVTSLMPAERISYSFPLEASGDDDDDGSSSPSTRRPDKRRIETELTAIASRSVAAFSEQTRLLQRVDAWLGVSAEREARYGQFRPLLSARHYAAAVALWVTFDVTCRAAGVTYFLTAGSLIGWHRHQGFIPWDDDLDVAIHVEHADLAWQALSCLPGYTLKVVEQSGAQWKLYPSDGDLVPGPTEVRFPFVDIMLVASSPQYVWALVDFAFPQDMTFPREDIVPVTLSARTFAAGSSALLPRDVLSVLHAQYDLEQCVSPRYDHRRERPMPDRNMTTVPCRELLGMYTMYYVG